MRVPIEQLDLLCRYYIYYTSHMDDRMTLKVPPDVRRLLRLIAAHTGEKHYEALRRVLSAEWEKLRTGD